MAVDRFTDQMQAYGKWKSTLVEAILKYQRWLEQNKMSEAEMELRIFELLEQLKSDTLTIAFVAEFARGKTELINGIFFSEYDRRLLPSEAGRTTCVQPSCFMTIRLMLPIFACFPSKPGCRIFHSRNLNRMQQSGFTIH